MRLKAKVLGTLRKADVGGHPLRDQDARMACKRLVDCPGKFELPYAHTMSSDQVFTRLTGLIYLEKISTQYTGGIKNNALD
jgi:hypothetical protein